MSAALELSKHVGVRDACTALGVSRATAHRRLRPRAPVPRPPNARALSRQEREEVLRVLNAQRFVDASPAEVHATLLDEGEHIASVSTMYRILREQGATGERRAVARHPCHARPELVATRPCQVWSWDITKVQGPGRRDWYHLYVILDIFSRYVVGWMLAATETASLAERFIAETLSKHGIVMNELTLHADRGTSMRSKTVAEMLADMGVTRSHSRPRVSNDNAFSEAQFKTMKYCPYFPGRFASVAEGREYLRLFFPWYNDEHHHSGIAMFTPATVHAGRVDEAIEVRQRALDASYAAHPERFINGPPVATRPPTEVWINRPIQQAEVSSAIESDPTQPGPIDTDARPSAAPVAPPHGARAAEPACGSTVPRPRATS